MRLPTCWFSQTVKSGGESSSGRGEESPCIRNPFELVLTPILESDPRPGDQPLHCLRGKHLTRARERPHSRRDVNGDPGDVVAKDFDLAGVDAHADVESNRTRSFYDAATAADGACRPIEGRDESVPRGIDLVPAEPGEFTTDGSVMRFE